MTLIKMSLKRKRELTNQDDALVFEKAFRASLHLEQTYNDINIKQMLKKLDIATLQNIQGHLESGNNNVAVVRTKISKLLIPELQSVEQVLNKLNHTYSFLSELTLKKVIEVFPSDRKKQGISMKDMMRHVEEILDDKEGDMNT